MISKNIRRDVFESVLATLHFVDNMEADTTDKFYKIRPIFDNLNKSGRFLKNKKEYSVDEIMIPYYGNNSSKQFIRNKPIR